MTKDSKIASDRSYWHSVEYELPPHLQDVIIAYRDYFSNYIYYTIGDYDDIEGKWYSQDDNLFPNHDNILAWMPIPEYEKEVVE